MMNKFNTFLILFIFLFTSCKSIKDGLSGSKNENSDEFLVQKKNPLVMPPEFMNLPKPNEDVFDEEENNLEEQTDIEAILNLETSNNTKTTSSSSAEDFVLDKINKR